MKIKIKRFDKSLPLPVYKTRGAVCVDLCARIDVTIKSRSVGYIPLNVAIEMPKNCWGLLAARSSVHKIGLMPVNGIGIIDCDYCGDGDEYIFAVYNFMNKKAVVKRGERVAQMMALKYEPMKLVEANKLKAKDRGKFGTTGRN